MGVGFSDRAVMSFGSMCTSVFQSSAIGEEGRDGDEATTGDTLDSLL